MNSNGIVTILEVVICCPCIMLEASWVTRKEERHGLSVLYPTCLGEDSSTKVFRAKGFSGWNLGIRHYENILGQGLNVRLDSTEDEIGTLQHKFRIVPNGKVDKLFTYR